MYKPFVLLCVVFCVIEARPKWQFLPPRDGYVPVYIRPGDTPLEEINPDLAEAFHALPAGRSAGKDLEAATDQDKLHEDKQEALQEAPQEVPQSDQPREHEIPEESAVDRRPYEKKILERKNKKANEIDKPVERR